METRQTPKTCHKLKDFQPLRSYSDDFAIMDRLAKSDSGNAEWQRDLSVSYNKVGGVQEAQGNFAGALKSYSDSLAIFEPLASFEGLALIKKQSGDKAKAREFLRQGHAIMARLTKLSPDNAQWKQDLAWFDREIKELAP
jgi:tetratricopeptide (TPR) repeat protein